jgi:hypothetical protein
MLASAVLRIWRRPLCLLAMLPVILLANTAQADQRLRLHATNQLREVYQVAVFYDFLDSSAACRAIAGAVNDVGGLNPGARYYCSNSAGVMATEPRIPGLPDDSGKWLPMDMYYVATDGKKTRVATVNTDGDLPTIDLCTPIAALLSMFEQSASRKGVFQCVSTRR